MIWRETGLMPKIGVAGVGVDGRSLLLVLIWCVHWMWLTFYLMTAAFLISAVFDFMGYDIYNGTRKLRRMIAGSRVASRRADQKLS